MEKLITIPATQVVSLVYSPTDNEIFTDYDELCETYKATEEDNYGDLVCRDEWSHAEQVKCAEKRGYILLPTTYTEERSVVDISFDSDDGAWDINSKIFDSYGDDDLELNSEEYCLSTEEEVLDFCAPIVAKLNQFLKDFKELDVSQMHEWEADLVTALINELLEIPQVKRQYQKLKL